MNRSRKTIQYPRVQVWLIRMTLLTNLGCATSSNEALLIFAASSLTDGFQDLAKTFEEQHPQHKVQLSFAGSQTLRLQIEQGAPADLVATANHAHIDALKRSGHLKHSRVFAHNQLALIVPRENPSKLYDLGDLPQANRIVLGTEHVPVGQYTLELLNQADAIWGDEFSSSVWSRVVSRESNARLVRAKVELGEADAAIVYQTDTMTSSSIDTVPIPSSAQIQVDYHIGRTVQSMPIESVEAWEEWMESDTAENLLRKHGFVVH